MGHLGWLLIFVCFAAVLPTSGAHALDFASYHVPHCDDYKGEPDVRSAWLDGFVSGLHAFASDGLSTEITPDSYHQLVAQWCSAPENEGDFLLAALASFEELRDSQLLSTRLQNIRSGIARNADARENLAPSFSSLPIFGEYVCEDKARANAWASGYATSIGASSPWKADVFLAQGISPENYRNEIQNLCAQDPKAHIDSVTRRFYEQTLGRFRKAQDPENTALRAGLKTTGERLLKVQRQLVESPSAEELTASVFSQASVESLLGFMSSPNLHNRVRAQKELEERLRQLKSAIDKANEAVIPEFLTTVRIILAEKKGPVGYRHRNLNHLHRILYPNLEKVLEMIVAKLHTHEATVRAAKFLVKYGQFFHEAAVEINKPEWEKAEVKDADPRTKWLEESCRKAYGKEIFENLVAFQREQPNKGYEVQALAGGGQFVAIPEASWVLFAQHNAEPPYTQKVEVGFSEQLTPSEKIFLREINSELESTLLAFAVETVILENETGNLYLGIQTADKTEVREELMHRFKAWYPTYPLKAYTTPIFKVFPKEIYLAMPKPEIPEPAKR